MSKIELININKYYGDNHVLRDLNLTIEDGAIKLNAKDLTKLMKAIVDDKMILPATPVPTAPYVK